MNAVVVLGLAVGVWGKGENGQAETTGNGLISVVAVLVGLLILLFCYEKRNNYRYTRELRGKIGDWIFRYRARSSRRSELRQKIDAEQPQTPKSNAFDHEKAYIQAYPETPQQQTATSLRNQQVLPQQIPSSSPQANFKQVFAVKQSKSKHKQNKKSKSKLKNRLMGRGSDEDDHEGEHVLVEQGVFEDNSLSNDNVEGEEGRVET